MGPDRVIAILGMHRSGTSCLAGSLQAAGLELGAVFTENPHNRKGNRESREIMSLHEAVLAANGCSWNAPLQTSLHWPPELIDERRRIIAKHHRLWCWGFKDPRSLLTLEGWREDLPHLERVGTFRHPGAVAASLMRRSPRLFDRERAIALWQEYNKRLLSEWAHDPFPLIEFGQDHDRLLGDLVRIAQQLSLPESAKVTTFFEPDLQHQRPEASDLDASTTRLYHQLIEIAGSEC